MILSNLSRTAVLTLIGRAVESEMKKSNLNDPMVIQILEMLLSNASEEEKNSLLQHK